MPPSQVDKKTHKQPLMESGNSGFLSGVRLRVVCKLFQLAITTEAYLYRCSNFVLSNAGCDRFLYLLFVFQHEEDPKIKSAVPAAHPRGASRTFPRTLITLD